MIKDGDGLKQLISLPNPHLTVSAQFSNYIKADKGSEGVASSRMNYRRTPAMEGSGHIYNLEVTFTPFRWRTIHI